MSLEGSDRDISAVATEEREPDQRFTLANERTLR